MHKYLRAVGFSNFEKKSDIDEFFKENLSDKSLVSTYIASDMRLCGQHNIKACPDAGIAVIGEQNKGELSSIDFYYPYVNGYDYTLIQECTIERHSDKESYAGIIDDYRMGMALIFYLTNGNVYSSLIKKFKFTDIKIDKIFLSALSVSGRIILPIEKRQQMSQVDLHSASKFVIDEDDVDEDEINIDDFVVDEDNDEDDNTPYSTRLIDNMSDFSEGIGMKAISIGIGIKLPKSPAGEQENRLKNEDLYSIVETSLVPYGIECDKYQIVAEILSVNKKTNVFTNEILYEMRVNTMGLQFNLMINEKDLEGEPLPGRRFRGIIWLQGNVEFLTKFDTKDQKE